MFKDGNLDSINILGVDHCGHRYGSDHPEMSAKLRQMDDLVHNLTKLMDDETVLFVMGDHGMTPSGMLNYRTKFHNYRGGGG